MEAMLLGDDDSDSDDNSTGEAEVIGVGVPMAPTGAAVNVAVNVPAAAAAAVVPIPTPQPIFQPPPAAPSFAYQNKPVPTPLSAPAPVSRIVQASVPAPIPVPTPIRTTTAAPSPHMKQQTSSIPPPGVTLPRQMQQIPVPNRSSIPPHAMASRISTAPPGSTSNPISMSQTAKLKSLYKTSPAVSVPVTSSRPVLPQPHKAYDSQPSNVAAATPIPISIPMIEPTPLTVIQAKNQPSRHHPMHNHNRTNQQLQQQQQQQQLQQQQQQQQQQHNIPPATATTQRRSVPPPLSSSFPQYSRSAGATPSQSSVDSQKASKERKEQFLMFTKVLMKYLEQKDQKMHASAKEVIRECAKKNKAGDPAFSSLSTSMQGHLKRLVGDAYWKKAEDYLRQYLHTQYVKKGEVPEEARRKADAMARSAASPLALDASTMVSHPRSHSGQSIGHRQAVVASQQRSMSSSQASAAAAANPASAQSSVAQANYAKIQQQQQAVAARKAQQDRAAQSAVAAAAKKISKANSNLTIKNPINTAGSGSKASSGKSNKGAGGGTPVGTGTPTATTTTTTTSKKKKTVKKNTAAANAAATALSVPKEYNDAMEMLDHIVDYDVSSCALILGNNNKKRGESIISEEQRKLLYHDFGITKIGPRKGLNGGREKSESPTSVTSQNAEGTTNIPSFLKGWSSRNIVCSRTAWAKLRLEEDEEQAMDNLSLPGTKLITATSTETSTLPKQSIDMPEFAWFNEQKAEEDETLVLISEATQYYIKTILEGAMNSASKRLNLDGIRLMHQQHAVANMKEAQKADDPTKTRDPPLHLRLGCDIRRQYALVQGNAAKTYQRLEEALEGQERTEMNAETMYNATSMTELSKIPKISYAAAKADYNAKRIFEIYGGKESGELSLGRVPKKAKIMAKDFRVCLEESSFAVSRKRVSTSAFF